MKWLQVLRILLTRPVMLAILSLTLGVARAETAEKLLSLEFRETPLSEVLQRLTRETGYDFIYNSAWRGYRVSADLKQVTLYTALRQILSHLNHAVIQLPENKIKLVIMNSSIGQAGSSPGAPQSRGRDRRLPIAPPVPSSVQEQAPQAVEGENVQVQEEANQPENQPATN